MNPSVASLICACGIAVLFYLDRDSSVRTSKALWLPVIYLWITGSRSVSDWLNIPPQQGADTTVDGHPVDILFYTVLLALAVTVLMWRGKRTITLLTANWPVLIYFCYCLISICWAYYPDVAFKRWIKAIGDLAMVLVVATDQHPVAALNRLFPRIGFLLLPTSVLLIKYYGALGRVYTPDGLPMNAGVTIGKNQLGLAVLVIALGTFWNVQGLLRDRTVPHRSRRLVAQGTLLAFALALFQMANSATSTACFILGGGLMLATSLRVIRSRPARVHALCVTIVLVAGVTLLFDGQTEVVHALGRQKDLTGRTEIWAAAISAVHNPITGAGFESFWIGPGAEEFRRTLSSWWHPQDLNEAHNGYVEIYLNLGWVGVCLIALILIGAYKRAAEAFRRCPEVGGLILAYVAVGAVYNITEAGFRMLSLCWIFLLLAVFSASGSAAGMFEGKQCETVGPVGDRADAAPAIETRILEREPNLTREQNPWRGEWTIADNAHRGDL
jgi:exopolysaccharide production protein ExoQ